MYIYDVYTVCSVHECICIVVVYSTKFYVYMYSVLISLSVAVLCSVLFSVISLYRICTVCHICNLNQRHSIRNTSGGAVPHSNGQVQDFLRDPG